MSFLLWILVLLTIWSALRRLLQPLLELRGFKALFFPGVLLAIAARSVACGLTLTRLKSVNFPWRTGPPVEHDRHGIPVLGPLVSTLLPPAAGIAAILALRPFLATSLVCEAALRPMDPSVQAVPTFLETSAELVDTSRALLRNEDLQNWQAALFLYVTFCILAFTGPTYLEWKILASLIGASLVLVACLEYFGIRPSFLSRGWFVQYLYGDACHESLALLVMLSLFAAVVAGATRGTFLFLLATIRPERPEGQGTKDAGRGANPA